MAPRLRPIAAVFMTLVVAVPAVLLGFVLTLAGSVPFGNLAPFTGEPIYPSTGERVLGGALIALGLVVGLALPVATAFLARRWARSAR